MSDNSNHPNRPQENLTFRGSNSWTNGQTGSQTSTKKRRVRFSHSTTVRMIENPDTFSSKFRNFKRCFVKTLPCLNIDVAPFREYETQTDFDEKKGDLAKFGMPPKKRSSIGEIDLGELKSQLDRIHKLSERMQSVSSKDKLQVEEIKNVHDIES